MKRIAIIGYFGIGKNLANSSDYQNQNSYGRNRELL